jgi:Inosine-uridine nucleoside N-ribohydrolase
MLKRPLLIDCDPGVDDTFAILLAASRPEFEIVAINPVAGNVPLSHTTENALRLAKYLDIACRVGIGAERPLSRTLQTAAHVHGNNGLGGTAIPAEQAAIDDKSAWDVMYEEAKRANGSLEVVALGPLTNIAKAVTQYPDIVPLIKQLTIMGGSADKGNSTPYAEFNIWVDPDACQIVLDSGIPTVFCGLDGIHSACLTEDELRSVVSAMGSTSEFMKPVAEFLIGNVRKRGETGLRICDLVTMACMIEPESAKYNHCYAYCETADEISIGQTHVDLLHVSEEKPNVQWMTEFDKEKYLALLNNMAEYYAAK